MPREDLDHVPGWKGDVEEETNLAGDVRLFSRLADGGGGQHEVVVVDPDQRHRIHVSRQTLQSRESLLGKPECNQIYKKTQKIR